MNIFYLHPNPTICAQSLHDKHCVKMILETTQLLCTAAELLGAKIPAGYAKSHTNHPCSVWVRKSAANYQWTQSYLDELHREYEYRYMREHDSKYLISGIDRAYDRIIANPLNAAFSLTGITDRPQCMPDKYKHPNVMQAYRDYYIGEKIALARWTMRGAPDWIAATKIDLSAASFYY